MLFCSVGGIYDFAGIDRLSCCYDFDGVEEGKVAFFLCCYVSLAGFTI